jgi:hypothetical protein
MQIIDDFLPEDVYQDILREINGVDFPWFYKEHSSFTGDNVPQFVHIFYVENEVNSSSFQLVVPLITMFELKTDYKIELINRAKANLLVDKPYKKENLKKTIHKDMNDKGYISLLYYVEDSDGDTIIYSKDKKKEVNRVSPRANRAFIFKGDEWHNATPPKKHQTRKIINIILKVK